MSVEGTWQLVIDTPIGKQRTVVELSTKDGALHGVARDQRPVKRSSSPTLCWTATS